MSWVKDGVNGGDTASNDSEWPVVYLTGLSVKVCEIKVGFGY